MYTKLYKILVQNMCKLLRSSSSTPSSSTKTNCKGEQGEFLQARVIIIGQGRGWVMHGARATGGTHIKEKSLERN